MRDEHDDPNKGKSRPRIKTDYEYDTHTDTIATRSYDDIREAYKAWCERRGLAHGRAHYKQFYSGKQKPKTDEIH